MAIQIEKNNFLNHDVLNKNFQQKPCDFSKFKETLLVSIKHHL